MARCTSTYPVTLAGRPVRCESAKGHSGDHGHSFAARYWTDDPRNTVAHNVPTATGCRACDYDSAPCAEHAELAPYAAPPDPIDSIAYPAVHVYRTGDYRHAGAVVTLAFGEGDAYFTLRRLPRSASAPAVWAMTLDGGYHFPSVNAGDYVTSIKDGIVLACERRARILAGRKVYGR